MGRRAKVTVDYDALMARWIPDYQKKILYCIKEKDYIETGEYKDGTCQHGTVVEIIRDKYGIPACFKVSIGSGKNICYDYISATAVTFLEPYDSTDINDPYLCDSDEYDPENFPWLFTNPEEKLEETVRYYIEDPDNEEYVQYILGAARTYMHERQQWYAERHPEYAKQLATSNTSTKEIKVI